MRTMRCGMGMMVMVMVCSTQAAWATVISPDIVGSVGENSGAAMSGALYDGNASAANHMFLTVEKYALSQVAGTVQNAVLTSKIAGSNAIAGYYFIVQHYTFDNSVALCGNDAWTPNVETIPGIETPVDLKTYTWDVTSYVQHDVTAGYSHSGFRIVLTDASGIPVSNTGGIARCILWDAASSTLSVTVPEPMTVGLLMFGLSGIMLRRRG